MNDVALRVENISKRYQLGERQASYRTLGETLSRSLGRVGRRAVPSARRAPPPEEEMWALKDVSLEVRHGDVVGIIGRNGAGKSTLLKILSRITDPTEGHADIYGRVGSLLEVGTGFHAELTGRENTYLNGAILGMKKGEIERKFDEIVAFAEVERFIDTPVKHYSSGMYLRLAFAVAAHLEPEILLVDEVLAVGDAVFQQKCLGKMGEVAEQGRTVLFVSHNMGAVRSLCTRGVTLHRGRVLTAGPITQAVEAYHGLVLDSVGEGRRGGAASDGATRAGFGPVSLVSHGSTTVPQSDAFELATALRVTKEVTGFSLFCIAEDMHGRTIFHLREESPQLGVREVSPGELDVRVTLPPLWLVPGMYTVYFKVLFWGELASSRVLSDVFLLDVEGENSKANAVLHPRAGWSVQRPEGEL
jgi:lipopolysaccharide transport system ATP-binding protein